MAFHIVKIKLTNKIRFGFFCGNLQWKIWFKLVSTFTEIKLSLRTRSQCMLAILVQNELGTYILITSILVSYEIGDLYVTIFESKINPPSKSKIQYCN
ncbi:hypothetical protein MtrunA17_Chr8g0351621 [Medicago truncatula]|uniref:Uncharacterized protein n=1 Tax=Medicago truncatula TaxID=3880 RepID=A0A396GII1_MEDTR|nr:hypothetical protein MtrunA17_Chr8g0351621 [Medicago truncatula]